MTTRILCGKGNRTRRSQKASCRATTSRRPPTRYERSHTRKVNLCIIQVERFKPRMAICTYHRVDDINVIPGIIGEARDDYHMHAKNLDLHWGPVNPKIIFFN